MRNACKVDQTCSKHGNKIIIIVGNCWRVWRAWIHIRAGKRICRYGSSIHRLCSMRSLYTELMMMNGNKIGVYYFNICSVVCCISRLLFQLWDRKNGCQKNLYVQGTQRIFFQKIAACSVGGTAVSDAGYFNFYFFPVDVYPAV